MNRTAHIHMAGNVTADFVLVFPVLLADHVTLSISYSVLVARRIVIFTRIAFGLLCQ